MPLRKRAELEMTSKMKTTNNAIFYHKLEF